MSQKFLPLCRRLPEDWIAQCSVPLAALGNKAASWQCRDFLGHVTRLAALLPERSCVINFCENRYLFTVGFCAAILKRQTTLLPQNRAEATQRNLVDYNGGAYILHDGIAGIADGIADFNINNHYLLGEPCDSIPSVEADFLAAIAFTSGSTGQPKANLKPWRTFVESSLINAKLMLDNEVHTYSALATVPAQHMWGLETSVLLALFGNLCISDSKLLFPQDIRSALSKLESPRLLISTPVHLRALVLSGLEMPPVARILCATAPLSADLASSVEELFQGTLVEIFGCSEVGSMACRRTAKDDIWQLSDDLHFTALPNDAGHEVNAEHLPGSQILGDKIEWIGSRKFRLLGRGDDMIEIAGKRGSIQEMNKILMSAPGVRDGVVFLLDASGEKVNRPVALVVADDVSKESLTAHFTKYLDPVFLPRPLHFVASLPREENGKLVRSKLLHFFSEIKAAN